MCFTRRVLKSVPHQAFSIVEDVEYGIRLGEAGYRVHYADEAHVYGEMVSTGAAARSQRRRWEGGRRALARAHGMRLLGKAWAQRDPVLLDLAVDVLIPSGRVATILREFQLAFPTVDLRLHVEALGAIAALVSDGTAQLCIGGPVIADDPSFERASAGSVELIPVAAPNHALAQMKKPAPGSARAYIQLVLTDRSPLTEGRDFGVMSSRSWRLADLGAKHALLLEGIGWGNMPREMVHPDLDSGRLVELHLPDHRGGVYGLSALWRRDLPPGPATRWLFDRFVEWDRGAPLPSA